MLLVRPATLQDLDAIHEVQRSVYSDNLVERKKIFAGIIAYNQSLVAVADKVVGFLLAHPTRRNTIYLLHHFPGLNNITQEDVFIHDMSVLRSAKQGCRYDDDNAFHTAT